MFKGKFLYEISWKEVKEMFGLMLPAGEYECRDCKAVWFEDGAEKCPICKSENIEEGAEKRS